VTVNNMLAIIKDDPDWLYHVLELGEGQGLFLSTPHARLLALKYPSVLTLHLEYAAFGSPYLHISAQQGFELDPAHYSSSITAGIAFVPFASWKSKWILGALRALVDHVLFDPARTEVVVTPYAPELAEELTEAIADVFPTASHHLCETSVFAAFKSGGRAGLKPGEFNAFAAAWRKQVLQAPTILCMRNGEDELLRE
jgi:hypothetical protein